MQQFPLKSYARLRPPKGLCRLLRAAVRAVREVPMEELSPGEGWIERHGAYLMEEAEALRRALGRGVRLPGSHGVPRALTLARKIVLDGQGDVTAAGIVRTVHREMGEAEITQEELGMLPQAVRCALFEALLQAMDSVGRDMEEEKRARRLAAEWREGRNDAPPRDPRLLAWMADCLARQEAGDALRRLDEQGRREGFRAEEEIARMEAEAAETGLRLGRLIGALRGISRLPWERITDRLNPVAALLREEETYRRMDGAGRGMYCRQVNRIARKLRVPESAVARAAMTLREGKDGAAGEAGYFLLERPEEIAKALGKQPGSLKPPSTILFLLPLYAGAAAALGICIALGAPWYVWLAIPLCASEMLRHVYFTLLRKRFPARLIPRLYYKRLPKELRTLVVVPALLASRKQALRMARQLAVLRAANPDPNLDYMLLGDFPDSKTPEQPQDEEILLAARLSVEALNEKYGGGFYYLHRLRRWAGPQRCYTGRERKRGALETLNLLITEGEAPDALAFCSCDPGSLKGRYAYVITLDADTFLPSGAALKMIGAMEHPLQKGRVRVIQPRMETAADAVVTRAQMWLGSRGGVDPYETGAQDVYQDVFGKGSFVGKGIYEPRAWLAALRGKLSRGRLLSHDLIEGEIAGGALASDIVLYDGLPAELSAWRQRLHRWTRGDWQLLPFLRDRDLPLLSRYKIWDNLRRSLVPAAQGTLLLTGAALNRPTLFLLGLPWPLRGMEKRLLILPGKICTLLDAVLRSLYRQFISHRNLLDWVTAAQADGGGRLPLSCVLFQAMAGGAMIVLSLLPKGWWPGAVLGMAWAGAALTETWMDRPLRLSPPMTPRMEKSVRRLARDTWRFFADTVTADTMHLPPDNVQTDPFKGPALRTSPTNIGLYLLSCCAARELSLISTGEMARRLSDTMRTLDALPRWKGHFYNWYDLRDGTPLHPAFVSTVDSGNLAGCLLCCAQECRNRLTELGDEYRSLPHRMDALARGMDFAALYDKRVHLFRVGWDARADRPAAAHYDMLASEARLASFVAILLGQVEKRHWRYLNRSVTRAGGGGALLSWGGTMFEYLMPHLLLPLTPGTLLGEGCLAAVRAQMSDDPSRPFGVSESGWYAFDPDMNYQYRAFGLPRLAVSGETAGRVIAPYASLLALPFFPRAVGENLLRMERLGWRDEHGLFEAVDDSPQRLESGPRIVKSHMAHHQGMILCSVCNALCGMALVRAFMTPPEAKACADLLWERVPGKARRRPSLPKPREEAADPHPLWRTVRRGLPLDAQLLSGGGMSWLLSANGQGYLKHHGMMITRFDPEAGAQTGPQLYVRETRTGAVIRPAVQGSAVFGEGAAHFTARLGAWHITLRCSVDPLLGMAVMAVQAENGGADVEELEIVSYLEAAQSAQEADAAHPNFRDLSVRIHPWRQTGLMSERLPRDAEEEAPWIGHAVLGEVASLYRQGDRIAFLGREGSVRLPEQLCRDPAACFFRAGDVIAPCLSLRAGVRVKPGEKAALYFVTLCGKNRAALEETPLTPDRARAAFSLAATRAKTILRQLRMDGRMLGLYQQALGAAAFAGQPHQAALPSASLGALWRYGVSGALPVLLINLLPGPDRTLIRHALRAHAWMRLHGFRANLIFFCPEETAYLRPCRDAVERLVNAGVGRELQNLPGGIFVVSGNETEEKAAESLARFTLRSGLTLAEQMAALKTPVPLGMDGGLNLPAAPPASALSDHNSFGGFTEDGAYQVTRPAPAPWHHMVCGPLFGTLLCETGILSSYAGNSRMGRLTRLCPDVHRGMASEHIFLTDEDGSIYPLTRCPVLYEPGAATYAVQAGETRAEVCVFPLEDRAMGARCVTLRSETPRTVKITWLIRFSLGERGEFTRCRGEDPFVFARSGEFPGVAWAAMEGGRCQAVSPAVCFGLGEEEVPPAMTGPVLGVGGVGFLTRDILIQPRETFRLTLALGHAENESRAKEDFARFQEKGAGIALRETRLAWETRLGGLRFYVSDPNLRRMMNLWLPYQIRAARLMARMGPYQQGGAIGFRDQLQDMLALLYTEPAAVRAHLLLCAAHQFPEGDVQHWWHPDRLGVRTRISDDRLFLPYLTSLYVGVTGDGTILTEPAPYLLSPPLGEGENDRFEQPEVSSWREPLMSHCLRAIDAVRLGAHDLPLMGGGDWNDGMNRVGGKTGESVWLGFFLALTLRELEPLCPEEIRQRYVALRRRVLDGAEKAWTGAWYLRAWDDGGRPLAGPDTQPPRIDLISQAFAALAGAPRHHARTAVRHAVERLFDREAGMVKLLDPPFVPAENAGYIGGYLPGVRENGGQYTHAVPWLILALCRLGEGTLAWEITRRVLPAAHSDTAEKARVYRLEPYVLAGDVYAGENRGRGGWSWYTGSAAWLYHAVLTGLMGFEKRGEKARLRPVPVPDPEEFTVEYRYGAAVYRFTAARDTLFPTLDGAKLDDGWAPLADDGRTHEARFPLRDAWD